MLAMTGDGTSNALPEILLVAFTFTSIGPVVAFDGALTMI
jgi:hypothetical protein